MADSAVNYCQVIRKSSSNLLGHKMTSKAGEEKPGTLLLQESRAFESACVIGKLQSQSQLLGRTNA